MKWEIENGGTLGEGSDGITPVLYPRSDLNRGQSDNNKGNASTSDNVLNAVALDNTGNVNVPRNTADVKYDVGPYPEARLAPDDEADMEGSGTA